MKSILTNLVFVLVGLLCIGVALTAAGQPRGRPSSKDFSELAQRIEAEGTNFIRRDTNGEVVFINAGYVRDDELALISCEPSIRELTFIGPYVTDKGLTALQQMTNLVSLTAASSNAITIASRLNQLRRLNTWCGRLKPPDLAYLIKMTNLEDLVIRGDWEMGSNAVSAMTNLTHLKRLVLGGGGDEGFCAYWISEFQREGHENGTNWDGWHYPKTDEFKALTNLTSLEELQIWSFTMFGDEQLRDLRQLPNLKSLKLYDTQVSDNWSNIVRQFPSLTNAERSVFDPRLLQEWSRVR